MKIPGAILGLMLTPFTLAPPVENQLRFQASVSRVTLAVVVRDARGRPVRGLVARDFDVRDQGVSRPITDFRNDLGTVSIAILADTSGSMRVGPKLDRVNDFATLLFAVLGEDRDEAALFAFDREVYVVQDFTSRFGLLRAAFATISPFGSTSLYDAIADTAQRVAQRPGRHAVVVLTDGVDTSSRLTEPEVSSIAAAIDVPVYVVAVGLSVDLSPEVVAQTGVGSLENLSRWTGGMFYTAANLVQASGAAQNIVEDLRHQYLIGLEPSSVLGWHRLDVRVRQRATIQARSGYWVGPPNP